MYLLKGADRIMFSKSVGLLGMVAYTWIPVFRKWEAHEFQTSLCYIARGGEYTAVFWGAEVGLDELIHLGDWWLNGRCDNWT